MNQGKAAWYILQRSLKLNKKERADIVVSSGTVGVSKTIDPFMSAISACNDLLSKGVLPVGVNSNILLPLNAREQRIKEAKALIDEACEMYGISLESGHTAVVDSLREPVCTIAAYGRHELERKRIAGATDIVLIGYTALGGTYVLANDYKEVLSKRFSSRIMSSVLDLKRSMSIQRIMELLSSADGISYVSDVSEGGIFQSLWELSETLECGFEVRLDGIPLMQETIEICDYFDINPYEMLGTGAVILICSDGEKIRELFEDSEYPVAVIGSIVSGNDKVVIAHEEKRYLESKREDSLYQARKRYNNERKDT